MKKLLFNLTALWAFAFPIFAQELTPIPEVEPVEILTLKKGNIPEAIQKTAEKLFQGDTQVAWGTFPYELKDYGWSVNTDYNDPIDHYEIKFKAKDGSDIVAIFESTGELIKCKIVNMNAPIPRPVLTALQKSEYKDWRVVGNVMLIKDSQKKNDEHYMVKVEKDKSKKTLYYTPAGDLLAVK